MSTTGQLIEEYARWWKKWEWDWFCTLTFPGYSGRNGAIRKFQQWIGEVERAQGATDFRYVRVIETGAYGDNVHIHALVGGLEGKARLFPVPWRERWEKIAGCAAITRFDAKKGGVWYMLKTLHPARDFDVDFHFPQQVGKEAVREAVGTKRYSGSAKSGIRRRTMSIYKGVLTLKRTTAGTVVYGNHDLPAQYLSKELLRAVTDGEEEYPQELVFTIGTVGKKRGSPSTMPRSKSATSRQP